jgi:hypothetical protein
LCEHVRIKESAMTKASVKAVVQTVQGLGVHAALRAIQYNAAIRALNRRYGRPKPRGRFHTLGDVKTIEKRPHGILIHAENGYVEVNFVSAEIVRVRMRTTPDFPPPFSYAVTRIDWPQPLMQTRDEPPVFTASTDQLVCRVHREGCRLTFETPGGQVISADASGGLGWRENEVRWTRCLPGDEQCFGLGQRASSLNLRGKRYASGTVIPCPPTRAVTIRFTTASPFT